MCRESGPPDSTGSDASAPQEHLEPPPFRPAPREAQAVALTERSQLGLSGNMMHTPLSLYQSSHTIGSSS
ncbi:hypothetical protein NITHO_2130002 [Nitrolancea hollandica Lb]|uniref:Uncharacterized protein n=1 Tax=Nitrolancea hollandica Lb TaxID=1129897 RepID=I4EF03_9BACT|nr:hypothetical protein NITHO_2130002 [Nitrolancea hollandica Lb]